VPTVIAVHDVRDNELWTGSSRREEFLGPLGVTNIRTFADPQNPTQVGLVMDVADLDAMLAALQTQAGADTMQHDGVLPETVRILVEQ